MGQQNQPPLQLNGLARKFVESLLGLDTETINDRRIRRVWLIGFTALTIHGILDPFVSYLAIRVFDVADELNPLMAPYFQGSIVDLFLVHLPLFLITITGLILLTWLFSLGTDSQKEQVYRLALAVFSLMILWGLGVVANNLAVLLQGVS